MTGNTSKTAESILKEAKLHRRAWGKRIIKAERGGGFNTEDLCAAESWRTCATGVLKGISRDPSWIPHDCLITRMGAFFTYDVRSHNTVRAAKRLVGIEKRAKFLRDQEFSNRQAVGV